ncbi:hypothetical protein HDU97_002466 [Phlyctochytrium planicorne]|nr:hypothetical protein HDU97_002466 [Phlyctochytrium planicorne]
MSAATSWSGSPLSPDSPATSISTSSTPSTSHHIVSRSVSFEIPIASEVSFDPKGPVDGLGLVGEIPFSKRTSRSGCLACQVRREREGVGHTGDGRVGGADSSGVLIKATSTTASVGRVSIGQRVRKIWKKSHPSTTSPSKSDSELPQQRRIHASHISSATAQSTPTSSSRTSPLAPASQRSRFSSSVPPRIDTLRRTVSALGIGAKKVPVASGLPTPPGSPVRTRISGSGEKVKGTVDGKKGKDKVFGEKEFGAARGRVSLRLREKVASPSNISKEGGDWRGKSLRGGGGVERVIESEIMQGAVDGGNEGDVEDEGEDAALVAATPTASADNDVTHTDIETETAIEDTVADDENLGEIIVAKAEPEAFENISTEDTLAEVESTELSLDAATTTKEVEVAPMFAEDDDDPTRTEKLIGSAVATGVGPEASEVVQAASYEIMVAIEKEETTLAETKATRIDRARYDETLDAAEKDESMNSQHETMAPPADMAAEGDGNAEMVDSTTDSAQSTLDETVELTNVEISVQTLPVEESEATDEAQDLEQAILKQKLKSMNLSGRAEPSSLETEIPEDPTVDEFSSNAINEAAMILNIEATCSVLDTQDVPTLLEGPEDHLSAEAAFVEILPVEASTDSAVSTSQPDTELSTKERPASVEISGPELSADITQAELHFSAEFVKGRVPEEKELVSSQVDVEQQSSSDSPAAVHSSPTDAVLVQNADIIDLDVQAAPAAESESVMNSEREIDATEKVGIVGDADNEDIAEVETVADLKESDTAAVECAVADNVGDVDEAHNLEGCNSVVPPSIEDGEDKEAVELEDKSFDEQPAGTDRSTEGDDVVDESGLAAAKAYLHEGNGSVETLAPEADAASSSISETTDSKKIADLAPLAANPDVPALEASSTFADGEDGSNTDEISKNSAAKQVDKDSPSLADSAFISESVVQESETSSADISTESGPIKNATASEVPGEFSVIEPERDEVTSTTESKELEPQLDLSEGLVEIVEASKPQLEDGVSSSNSDGRAESSSTENDIGSGSLREVTDLEPPAKIAAIESERYEFISTPKPKDLVPEVDFTEGASDVVEVMCEDEVAVENGEASQQIEAAVVELHDDVEILTGGDGDDTAVDVDNASEVGVVEGVEVREKTLDIGGIDDAGKIFEDRLGNVEGGGKLPEEVTKESSLDTVVAAAMTWTPKDSTEEASIEIDCGAIVGVSDIGPKPNDSSEGLPQAPCHDFGSGIYSGEGSEKVVEDKIPESRFETPQNVERSAMTFAEAQALDLETFEPEDVKRVQATFKPDIPVDVEAVEGTTQNLYLQGLSDDAIPSPIGSVEEVLEPPPAPSLYVKTFNILDASGALHPITIPTVIRLDDPSFFSDTTSMVSYETEVESSTSQVPAVTKRASGLFSRMFPKMQRTNSEGSIVAPAPPPPVQVFRKKKRRQIDMSDLTGLATLATSRLNDLRAIQPALKSSIAMPSFNPSAPSLKKSYLSAAKEIALLGKGIVVAYMPLAKVLPDARLKSTLMASLSSIETLAGQMKVLVKLKSSPSIPDRELDAEGIILSCASSVVKAAQEAVSDLEAARNLIELAGGAAGIPEDKKVVHVSDEEDGGGVVEREPGVGGMEDAVRKAIMAGGNVVVGLK